MRIHRSSPDEHFTIIPNETLRDQRLSYTARGVLIELLSHADGWQTTADDLSEMARRHRGEKRGEGRRGIRNAFKELVDHGYIVRRRLKDESGKFVTVLEVFDTPGHGDATSDNRGTASGTSATGTSATGMSVTGTSSRSTNLRSTKEEEPTQEHSTSLADARAAADAARQRIKGEREKFYEAIRRMPDADLHDFMCTLEERRPRIYRQCRRNASAWLKENHPAVLKGAEKAVIKDQVTYMYALLHYQPAPPAKYEWDAWVVRPLAGLVGEGRAA
ncbi:helix-turn-helix domain-containing protein [Spirillospora sp. NPDC048911]|uniref:helix-turn-helix domain-containing protein n=1 Tax=Spirillospora sp. NPDC048911 TaxID=3364527 RepID=UPI00371200C2